MSSFSRRACGLGLVASCLFGLSAGCAAGEDSSLPGVPYQPGGDAGDDEPDDGARDADGDDEGDTGRSDDGDEPGGDALDGDSLDEGSGGEDGGTDVSTSGAVMGTTGDGGDDSTEGTESSGDDGPVDPPGTQPSSGMWASCDPDDVSKCDGADNCVGNADNGYCSVAECDDPAQDCADAPAETSVTPICASGGTTSVCALDCSSASCPTSMVCTKVSIDGGPEHDICL